MKEENKVVTALSGSEQGSQAGSSTTTIKTMNPITHHGTMTSSSFGISSQLSTIHEQTTFRNMSMNAIAVVPLLSNNNNNTSNSNSTNTTTTSHSTKSYYEFMNTLQQHPYSCNSSSSSSSGGGFNDSSCISLVVPNSNCTRPSDWKYETTPFTSFSWNIGCQRYIFYDGRPPDVLLSSSSTSSIQQQQHNITPETNYYHYTASTAYRNYIDLYPHRRTAAIIGILNIQDCIRMAEEEKEEEHATTTTTTTEQENTSKDGTTRTSTSNTRIGQMIHRACEELQQWAYKYSLPSYGATMYGHTNPMNNTIDRDIPVTRLYVYDTFNMESPIDINTLLLNSSNSHTTSHIDTNSIIAFPPTTPDHYSTMILHYNLIVSDLMVTIFRQLEQKVSTAVKRIAYIESATIVQHGSSSSSTTPGTGSDGTTNATAAVSTTTTGIARRSLARFVSSTTSSTGSNTTPTINTLGPTTTTTTSPTSPTASLGINQLASLVDPENELAKNSPNKSNANTTSIDDPMSSTASTTTATTTSTTTTTTKFAMSKQQQTLTTTSTTTTTTISKLLQLLTPMDDELMTTIYETSSMNTTTTTSTIISTKDMELLKKREMGRLYKYIGDICLLAGTPLDAYENYLKAMELCKSGSSTVSGSTVPTNHRSSLDPLWYAATLEACAVVHIVMAEIGGYGVDEYLENNFQLPEEIMALVRDESKKLVSASGNNKQTLPEVVFALCDEALNILNRHHQLGNLYAELVLKLATYTSEEAEAHLRCRWGDGPYCYSGGGDTYNSINNDNDQMKRWDKPSVSKLKFHPLRTKDGYSMITINTHNRIKKLCALLNVAVSIGSLDPSTRLDVAVRCAKICLHGIKPTHWKGPIPERIKLPRKAAFFVTVAAEAMTVTQREVGKITTAQSLWLLASRLYTNTPNPIDGGGGYGWTTLRAFCLDGLSTQGNTYLSLEASDQLLSLLGRLDPAIKPIDDISNPKGATANEEKHEEGKEILLNDESDKTVKSIPRASVSLEDSDLQDALTTANQFAKNLRATYNTFTAGSSLVTHQSKWASEKPIPPVDVPFSNSSLISSHVVSLKSVWPHMSFDVATKAQTHCLERAISLRRAIPKSSANVDATRLHNFVDQMPLIYIVSNISLQSDPVLDLDCIKKRGASDASKGGGLETFYNPFAKKATADGPLGRLAEEEERIITVEFGNNLSLPLQVQQSQLDFDDNTRVKTTSLSFTIPPKSRSFVVNFPFRVTKSTDVFDDCSTLEVKGVNITCLGRQIFLPIKSIKNAMPIAPESSRLHAPRVKEEMSVDEGHANPRIECYPCQPKLEILYAENSDPVPDVIPVTLTDGEVLTLPSFQLKNSTGNSGKVECFEVLLVGTPNRKLYDSSSESESAVTNIEDYVSEMIFGCENAPFKIRALTDGLDIEGINNNNNNNNNRQLNTLDLQIATGYNFRSRFASVCTLDIQFRYRGVGTSKTEVWRKRTISIQMKPVKGPRISSIVFRPDLMMNDLSFADDINEQWAACVENNIKAKNAIIDSSSSHPSEQPLGVNTVGQYPCVSVCGPLTVFILTVTNESRKEITICRNDESSIDNIYELDHLSYNKEFGVSPGVSVKIPMVSPRIARVDENGVALDVISMFIQKTTLLWKCSDNLPNSQYHRNQGYIRIPPICWNDIVHQLPATISQICYPPVALEMQIDANTISPNNLQTVSAISVSVGQPISLCLLVRFELWFQTFLKKEISNTNKDNLKIRMEFRCQRKGIHKMQQERLDYVWIGKLDRTKSLLQQQQLQQQHHERHDTKVVICTSGVYVITAVVYIIHSNQSSKTQQEQHAAEEIWWSPISQLIQVQ